MSPLTAARLAHGLTQKQVADQWNELWPDPDRSKSAKHVAVAETLAETGVHCAVRSALGTRLHPMTGALCTYFLAEHLTGEPDNRDPAENTAATWAPMARLIDFIPVASVYPPILDALGVAHV